MGKSRVLMLAVLLAGTAHGALFSKLVVFGDSLSDNGNAFIGTLGALPRPPQYTLGRFTDGPDSSPAGTPGGLWHEVLAGLLGDPVATPFLTGGANYAVSGANVVPGDPIIPSVEQQVGLSLSSNSFHADPNALYVFWGGANDLYNAAEAPGATAASVAAAEVAAVNGIANMITALASAGAENFLWLNLPQLGSTPRGAASPLSAALADASIQFAIQMAATSALLQPALNIRIADVDVYGLYQNILADPAAFGYTNVTTPAQSLSVNPDQYLFWDDSSHPTTTGHRLIGLTADAAVLQTFAPEPSTLLAVAGAFGLLMCVRRRICANG